MGGSAYCIRARLLIDGGDTAPIVDPVVVIQESKIDSVLSGWNKSPLGIPTYDFPLACMIPGLVDAHVHLALGGDSCFPYDRFATQPDYTLYQVSIKNREIHRLCGATTVRDCGGPLGVMRLLKNRTMSIDQSDLLVSGPPITKKGGHLAFYGGGVESLDEISALTTRLISEDVDFIKVMVSGGGDAGSPWKASFDTLELEAIVKQAHLAGKQVSAHCTCVDAISNALEAGVDIIEHAGFYGQGGRFTPSRDLADQIVRTGIYVCPTASFGLPEELASFDFKSVRNLQFLLESGVSIIGGSDAGSRGVYFGQVYREMKVMVASGMCMKEVIGAWTSRAAIALGLEDVGFIRPGYKANLLLLAGDLTDRLGCGTTAIRQVQAVVNKGVILPMGGM